MTARNDGRAKFEVRFAIEVHASSPEQAAAIARDMMLDPDTQLHGEVRAFEYYEPGEAWFPCEDSGVSVYFGDTGSMTHATYGGDAKPYAGGSVRPGHSVAWIRLKT
jgi:hypothetical protein